MPLLETERLSETEKVDLILWLRMRFNASDARGANVLLEEEETSKSLAAFATLASVALKTL
jgi:hypothetical protein